MWTAADQQRQESRFRWSSRDAYRCAVRRCSAGNVLHCQSGQHQNGGFIHRNGIEQGALSQGGWNSATRLSSDSPAAGKARQHIQKGSCPDRKVIPERIPSNQASLLRRIATRSVPTVPGPARAKIQLVVSHPDPGRRRPTRRRSRYWQCQGHSQGQAIQPGVSSAWNRLKTRTEHAGAGSRVP